MSKSADLSLGAAAENQLLPLFREKFDPSLRKTGWTFDSMDFESERCIVELKSRRCKFGDYKDMMIGANKVKRVSDEYARNKKKGYLVFNCTDAIYYWEFNPDQFKETVEYRMGGRNDRGKDEMELTAYIGKKHMKCLIKKELPVPVF